MKRVAIIGAGNIGSRHLQAMSLSKQAYEILVVDSYEPSLSKAKDMFEQCKSNVAHKVSYYETLDVLPEMIDVAIIATSSDVRRTMVEELLAHTTVTYLILEKVLFQSVDDYVFIEQYLKDHQVKAYVDCPRRGFAFYEQLKQRLATEESIEVMISGSNWGLGCNGIHMIDLIGFVCGSENPVVSIDGLVPNIAACKRPGFYEIHGTISGSMGRCRNFSITSYESGNSPLTITIMGNNFKGVISEGRHFMEYATEDRNWEWSEETFEFPFISQFTQYMVDALIETGDCPLPTYEESMKLHLALLTPLTSFFEQHGIGGKRCPIT